ncbi:MAG: glycogen synthase GlgA [Peptococcaceae bacterium]
MNILFAAAEAYPFIKTGGLGDVIGSLPRALQKENCNVGVILPLYSIIPDPLKEQMVLLDEFEVSLSWRKQYCGLKILQYQGINYFFIDNEYYYKRDGVYGFYDDGERFAFFSKAVLASLPRMGFRPQIIHCHDWHTGILNVYLKEFRKENTFYNNISTVFTIHNLKYQGNFPPEILGDLLGLDSGYFSPEALEFHGNINFMKAGIVFSDALTTVSKTYAEEIKDPFFGEGLDSLLQAYDDKLRGIINGIDYKIYNPLTDKALFINYRSSLQKKRENKVMLQKLLGLPQDENLPLFALISRLIPQKGLDLLSRILEELMAKDLQIVILGTGENCYEGQFLKMGRRYPRKLKVLVEFAEDLARKIYAGSDLFLMPSLFEPCGIGQLIAMRYGSVPIVRETGGLKDTVQSYNESSGEGNGFSFTNYNAHDFLYTIERALRFFDHPAEWNKIFKNAVTGEFSWKTSAQEYVRLYENLLKDMMLNGK